VRGGGRNQKFSVDEDIWETGRSREDHVIADRR
jgi:hypothetical protein